jgi:hypothetical protein
MNFRIKNQVKFLTGTLPKLIQEYGRYSRNEHKTLPIDDFNTSKTCIAPLQITVPNNLTMMILMTEQNKT